MAQYSLPFQGERKWLPNPCHVGEKQNGYITVSGNSEAERNECTSHLVIPNVYRKQTKREEICESGLSE